MTMKREDFKKAIGKYSKEVIIEALYSELWINGKKEELLYKCRQFEIQVLSNKIDENIKSSPKMPTDKNIKKLIQWKIDYENNNKEYEALNKKRDKLMKESY